MLPKKAIVIILILFLAVVIAFAILYVNKKQAIAPSDGLNANQAGQTSGIKKTEPVKSGEAVEEKVNKIIEDAKNDPNTSSDAVKQEIVSTINAEIIKQEQNKTPEQKAADLKAQEERQRIIDEINNKIKQAR